MATGEVGFSTRGKQARRFSFEPVPKADYQCKLDTSKLEVAKKEDPTSKPYLTGLRLELLDTAKEEGGKNSLVFVSFFTGITPSEKGNCAFEMMNGPLGIARALGQDIDVPGNAVKTYPGTDKNGEPNGSTVKIVDPNWLKTWLQQFDGEVIGAHIKIRKSKDYDPRNEVDYFIEKEAAEATGEADAFGSEEESISDLDEETEELEEPVQIRKPAYSKPAPKKAVSGKRR